MFTLSLEPSAQYPVDALCYFLLFYRYSAGSMHQENKSQGASRVWNRQLWNLSVSAVSDRHSITRWTVCFANSINCSLYEGRHCLCVLHCELPLVTRTRTELFAFCTSIYIYAIDSLPRYFPQSIIADLTNCYISSSIVSFVFYLHTKENVTWRISAK